MRLASLFLGLLTSAFCSEPARVIGLVVSIQGDWADSSGTPVEKGYAVWSNSTLRIRGQAQQGDDIRVRSFVNGEAIVFDCGKTQCGDPLDLSQVTRRGEAGASSSFFDAISATLSNLSAEGVRSVSGYSRALSKGPRGRLSDGVAVLDSSAVNLAPFFQDMQEGALEVQLCPVSKDGSSHCLANSRQNCTWRPGQDLQVSAAGIKPGLYEIGAYEEAQGMTPVRDSAMVLLVRKSAFERAQDSYGDAVRQTQDMSRSEQLMHRRVFLQSLNLTLNR